MQGCRITGLRVPLAGFFKMSFTNRPNENQTELKPHQTKCLVRDEIRV